MAAWHALPTAEILQRIESASGGLAPDEAARRLARYGRNEFARQDGPGLWALVGRQFKSLLVWLLLVAAGVSGALGEWVDCSVIAAILVLNACIGAFQEYSAERSLAALRRLSAPHAKVRRGDAVTIVPAAEVVLGDVLVLEAGDLIAADARLIESASLSCVEKSLTGESEPAEKRTDAVALENAPLAERFNMVYMGTAVATGTGTAVVVATGMQTEVGAIASLIQTTDPSKETPLQARLRRVGALLVYSSLAIVAAMFVVGLLRGESLPELLLTSVSVAVAAVPEGLPAIVTVALALGVRRMARRRALIRHLSAVETLGCTSVICTDKTGTLTVGQMTVRALWTRGATFDVSGEGYGPSGTVTLAGSALDAHGRERVASLTEILLGCNNASVARSDGGEWDAVGDPTEAALLVAASKTWVEGANREALDAAHPRIAAIPFDSERKRACVIRRWGGDNAARALINGSPEGVMALCSHILDVDGGVRPILEADREEILASNAEWASRALRVLGCARRDLPAATVSDPTFRPTPAAVERDLTFVGLVGMQDPPRPEAREAILRCKDAGIRVVMITGDQPRTARAIARDLGLVSTGGAEAVIAGGSLERMSDEELRARVTGTAVYARVTAADKLRIIRAWRATGAVVAMTGDGVNDAPALHGADVGVAMGRSGTEVAKQASDIVITDDNFASIVAAVEEGRGVYDNIRKAMQYLLGGNAAELLFIGACLFAGLPAPLLPVQILWINLVTDGLPALFLAADPVAKDVMRRRPRARSAGIMDRPFLFTTALTALLTAGLALGVYLHGLRNYDEQTARTHAFAAIVFAELLRSFGCRSATLPIWKVSMRSNLLLLIVVTLSFLIQIWSHHNQTLAGLLKTSTVDWSACMLLTLLAFIPLVALETVKFARIWFVTDAPAEPRQRR
jgi:Ca2+-transporting ATPase